MVRRPDPDEYILKITTNSDMSDWSFGRRYLTMLTGFGEELTPQVFDQSEPIRRRFESVEACAPFWAETVESRYDGALRENKRGFFWRRRKRIRSLGWVTHTARGGPRNEIIPGYVMSIFAPAATVDWRMLFRRHVELCEPIFASLHFVTAPERAKAEINGDYVDFELGAYGHQLAKGRIPQLAWGTFFGEAFADAADPEALAAAGFETERLANGWLLWLTPKIEDVQLDYPAFLERRGRARALFRPKLFLMPNDPSHVIGG